LKYINYNILIP